MRILLLVCLTPTTECAGWPRKQVQAAQLERDLLSYRALVLSAGASLQGILFEAFLGFDSVSLANTFRTPRTPPSRTNVGRLGHHHPHGLPGTALHTVTSRSAGFKTLHSQTYACRLGISILGSHAPPAHGQSLSPLRQLSECYLIRVGNKHPRFF